MNLHVTCGHNREGATHDRTYRKSKERSSPSSRRSSRASRRFARDSSTERPWLATSSSGHLATNHLPSLWTTADRLLLTLLSWPSRYLVVRHQGATHWDGHNVKARARFPAGGVPCP